MPAHLVEPGTFSFMEYRPDSEIDREVATPPNEQLAGILRARLASGEWKVGHRFASGPALARRYGMSRNTILKAISTLVDEGLLAVVPSSGTYVRNLRAPHSDRA